jgi:hypothetical protein
VHANSKRLRGGQDWVTVATQALTAGRYMATGSVTAATLMSWDGGVVCRIENGSGAVDSSSSAGDADWSGRPFQAHARSNLTATTFFTLTGAGSLALKCKGTIMDLSVTGKDLADVWGGLYTVQVSSYDVTVQ